jgi:hypothetical protein
MTVISPLYERQPAVIDIWEQCKKGNLKDPLILFWCLHMWDTTEQAVYTDLFLMFCQDYDIDLTPAMQEQVKLAAINRLLELPSGTVKKAMSEVTLWSAMVAISALKYHNPKKSIFNIVEKLQDKETGRFGNIKLETLEEYWNKRLTKSQKESLREFWDIQTRAPALWGEDILRLLEGILNPR